MSLNSDWQDFLSNSLSEKNIFSYIKELQEIISNFNPKTLAESRRIRIAEGHLREVRKYAKMMENDVNILQQKLRKTEKSDGVDVNIEITTEEEAGD